MRARIFIGLIGLALLLPAPAAATRAPYLTEAEARAAIHRVLPDAGLERPRARYPIRLGRRRLQWEVRYWAETPWGGHAWFGDELDVYLRRGRVHIQGLIWVDYIGNVLERSLTSR